MEEGYRTVAAAAQDEFIERKSRFIGYIAPVHTEEDAVAFVDSIRARHRDATHNCYAYALREGQLRRFSDDGEPQGTAGKPILEVLQREELVDTAIVVTRYFGGILLGTGGLVRAYTQGAKAAVDAAQIRNMRPAVRLSIDTDYGFYGKLAYLLPQVGAVVEDTCFADRVKVCFLLQQKHLSSLEKQLREMSGGMAVPVVVEKLWAHFTE